jgi:predicted negative regulator of RcsB-dependent stress response
MKRSQGFHAAGIVAVLAVLAVAGVIVWRVWPQPQAAQQAAAETINSRSDVQKSLDSLDSDDLDKQLDPSQFDDDITEVL